MIRVALHGSTGKMGRVIESLAAGEFSSEFQIAVGLHRGSSESEWEKLSEVEGIIDFSSAEGLNQLLGRLQRHSGVSEIRAPFLLTGSTGFGNEVRRKLEKLALQRRVLWASNFSPGIFLLKRALQALHGHPLLSQFQISLRDLHHVRKKDAPSGTALTLKETLGADFPIESIREGEIIGRHEVKLTSSFETVEFIHDASDRRLFARGSLLAARELNRLNSEDSAGPRRILTLEDIFS